MCQRVVQVYVIWRVQINYEKRVWGKQQEIRRSVKPRPHLEAAYEYGNDNI